MNKLNFAASRQVNPPGVSPKLTEEQVWKGLQKKVRQPIGFVAPITACEIISDTGNKVVRSVTFRDGLVMQEEIDLYEGTIAYFDASSTGIRITNTVSYDKDNEMILTFSFAGGIPGFTSNLPAGERPSAKDLNAAIGPGVEHTINRIRELVVDGTLA
ncbi:hypothetical protein BDZ97DRAFT_1930328 [Flammula alnicola]|nr:hypothetical protein BDZ97DRAFT_1930328 [Flammula alnicola]